MEHTVQLSTATDDDFGVIESWLRDGRVKRWIGCSFSVRQTTYMEDVSPDPSGPGHVAIMHKWAVRRAGQEQGPPVGYVLATVYGTGEITDRWNVRDPYYAYLLYFVDPHHRGGGIGTAMLRAAINHPDLTGVTEFRCGIGVRNIGSRRVARRAGFTRQPEPWPQPRQRRRMLSYVYRRHS
jgi:RimJ/RimL family protein N-acetyltransferase